MHMISRTVFFVSDGTGVTAETLGHSVLTQFDQCEFKTTTLPFVTSQSEVEAAASRIHAACNDASARPIVFTTLVDAAARDALVATGALVLDIMNPFLGMLEQEFNAQPAHAKGRAHGMADATRYAARINAINFAMANDDGIRIDNFNQADVILIGVSRCGKTPTCLYLALHYGMLAANYPLTTDDFSHHSLPQALDTFRDKLFGLTISPQRLQQIRQERNLGNRYASRTQIEYETDMTMEIFRRFRIPCIDTTECSVEEISSHIIKQLTSKRSNPAQHSTTFHSAGQNVAR